jgi:antitoxin HicB
LFRRQPAEWGAFCHTHGDTYEEALTNAQEVLETLIEGTIADGETLPTPQTFQPHNSLAAA